LNKPSFDPDSVDGGHLINLYKSQERNSKLSSFDVEGNVAISRFEGMSLSQYIDLRKHVCKVFHKNCSVCPSMIQVATTIKKHGFWKLKSAYICCLNHLQPCEICPAQIYSPQSHVVKSSNNYTSEKAKRKFLRMPLACITVPTGPNVSVNFLIEKDSNYLLMTNIIKKINEKKTTKGTLSKESVSNLIKSCSSDPERERLRYAICEASNMSKREVRRQFGFEDTSQRKEKVESALREQKEIRESIYKIACIKEKAILQSFGVDVQESSEESTTESESDEDNHVRENKQSANINEENYVCDIINNAINIPTNQTLFSDNNEGQPNVHSFKDKFELPLSKERSSTGEAFMNTNQLLDCLKSCRLNWIAFANSLKNEMPTLSTEALDQLLLDFASQLPYLNLEENEEQLIEQSRQIYLENKRVEEVAEEADGMIVSESGDSSDDAEELTRVNGLFGTVAKELIAKKVKNLRKQAARTAAKKIEGERFLRRKRSKHTGTILRKYPNIGKDIENFVKSRGVGAEQWRRTGVLTFDGNRKVGQKVTFSRIKEHLEELYDTKFSYGTVVQMCVARNRRRKAAANYQGVAHVTCRRARKGFEIKYNPDSHWSNAFYKILDYIQYKDGQDKLLLNRDDLSAFRLDSMCTSNKAPTHSIKNNPSLTTKTDFQARYTNTLQTTSYNFTESDNTAEICVGIVKSSGIHPKGPGQHLADLCFLENNDEVNHIFQNPKTDQQKEIECIRVDSGGDEALYHEEIQFFWTLRHMERPTRLQLVTCRYSGGSSLNRVELQNGCETKARAGLFIPSTLNGSNCIEGQGQIDQIKLQKNLSDAIDVYISRVSGASCGNTEIKLFHGETSSRNIKLKEVFRVVSKGTIQDKEKMKEENPDDYELVTKVLLIKQKHMKKSGIPLRYVFLLACCYNDKCPHPLCQKGKPEIEETWYKGGPPITFLPLPTKDKDRPFGWTECPKCPHGKCTGHFLEPSEVIQLYQSDAKAYKPMSSPPTQILKSSYNEFGSQPSNLEHLSKEVLLPEHEVCITLNLVHIFKLTPF